MANKFSDYNTLLDSYNQLEKQFTRKCQELSALKSQSGTSNSNLPHNNMLPPPISSIEQLLQKYPNARYYSEEITQLVNSPKYNINGSCNYLDCYLDLVSQSIPADKIASDSNLLEQYITSNSNVVDAVLNKVVASITPLPTTIVGNRGDMSMALPTRPKTIAEASSLAKNLFDN